MSQTILEMAKELVIEQIRQNHVSPDEAQSLLRDTHATLQALHKMEMSGNDTMGTASLEEKPQDAWQKSITKHAITCLECGETFKQLSARHLRRHDLDPRSYRAKYGIPRIQALSARNNTAHRRALAKQIRPWEKAAKSRSAAKGKAKASAKG